MRELTYEQPEGATSVALAVDVGGTGIKCAIVDTAGAVVYTERHPTGAHRGPDAVVQTILDAAATLQGRAHSRGLTPIAAGVVVPSIVDDGVAVWSANIGVRDVPLRDLVAGRLGLPTALGHDVRAGAEAEARLGAGRKTRRMLFVAIGTGIAGGYAVDGHVDAGAHGAGGEIGHVVIRTGPDALPCGCGGRGCLEVYASAAAIARAYAATSTPDPADTRPVLTASAEDVARRVAAGEARATAVWTAAVEALADGLLAGIALCDPEVIVLGGGLAQAGSTLLDPLRAALDVRRTFHRLPRVVVAELGDGAGCLGAALLALDLVGGVDP